MEEIKKFMEERKKYLSKLAEKKRKALETAPEGSLRIATNGNCVQYYHRRGPKDIGGRYINKKEHCFARELAQKDYDKKVLESAEKELDAIEKYLSKIPKKEAGRIYESLHVGRKKLITPIVETREDFVRRWQDREYKGKDFDETIPEIYTERGERVRSKSEVIIADSLSREGIPYHYEYPLRLKHRMIYPDFTVLNTETRREMYWEHLGMLDNAEYLEYALKKIAGYIENGIFPGENLILTYETQKTPINRKIVHLMIERYLKNH